MRVLGIDPGSTVTGFGVVELDRGKYVHVASGAVKTSADQPMGERLAAIHAFLVEALATHRPQAVAIEAIFHHKSSESALRLGQARGVALLAAAQAGHEATAYNNATVKATVGAHGRADKDAVAKVVGLLLGQRVAGPADITDALAIAICHLSHVRARGTLRKTA
jgi:crossover junction endodeoxyribonuclease RuvC